MEIKLRRLGQLGLEDIDSAKKSLTSLVLYKNIIDEYINKMINRMKEFGYSEESINKLLEKLKGEK